MILLPYRFCGDSHHAFAFPFVLIFLPLRLSCKESSTSNQAFSIVFTTPSVPLVGDRNLRRKDVTALLGARNRYAIRLAGHQSPRQVLRDGTAGLLWESACNYIAESECMEGACRLSPPELFPTAVSLCACRHSNEEYCFYTTFERITSGEVPIRGSMFQNGTNFFK